MYIKGKYNQIKWNVLCKIHPELRLKPSHPPFELHFSKKEKYVSCLISKNGCSSILASLLKYDFGEEFNIEENEKIWKNWDLIVPHVSKFRIWYDDTINTDNFKGYKKFVVLRNPFDRFISFINNTYKENEYDYLFDKSLSSEKYVDKVLELYPHMVDYTRTDRRYDKHAIPQRVYYDNYVKVFGDDLEIVPIRELPEYYENLTGHPLIKNNVTNANEKVCTKDSLTNRQKRLIMKYLNQYEYIRDDEYTRFFL